MCDGRSWCGGRMDFIAAADPVPIWAGFVFNRGPAPPSTPGLFILGRRDGARVYALHVEAADDIRQAMAAHAGAGADHFYWLHQPDAALRAIILRTVAGRYRPPGSVPARQPETDGEPEGPAWH